MNLETLEFLNLRSLIAGLLTAIVIAGVAMVLNCLAGRAVSLIARRLSLSEQELLPVRRTLKWLIALAAFVFILGALGLNVGGIWGVLSTVLAMIAIGFVALWSVLSNVLCTLIIMTFRPFAIGDDIEFAGEPVKGRVIDLNFIYTTLDAGEGTVMQVPNSLFFQKAMRRRHGGGAVSALDHVRAKQSGAEPAQPAAEPAPSLARDSA